MLPMLGANPIVFNSALTLSPAGEATFAHDVTLDTADLTVGGAIEGQTLTLDGVTTISPSELNVLDSGLTAPVFLSFHARGLAVNETYYRYNPSFADTLSIRRFGCYAMAADTLATASTIRLSDGAGEVMDCVIAAGADQCLISGAMSLSTSEILSAEDSGSGVLGNPENLNCTIEGFATVQ